MTRYERSLRQIRCRMESRQERQSCSRRIKRANCPLAELDSRQPVSLSLSQSKPTVYVASHASYNFPLSGATCVVCNNYIVEWEIVTCMQCYCQLVFTELRRVKGGSRERVISAEGEETAARVHPEDGVDGR